MVSVRGARALFRIPISNGFVRFGFWMFKTEPKGACILTLLLLVQGLVPAANIIVVRNVVDIALAQQNNNMPEKTLGTFLFIWATLYLVQQAITPLRELLTERVRLQMEQSMLERLHTKASRLRLDVFERSDFHDILQRARQITEPGEFLNLLWELLDICRSTIATASVAIVVGLWNPWLLLAVMTASLPDPIIRLIQIRSSFFARRKLTSQERLQRYLEQLLTSREPAKEIRVFGAGPKMIQWWDRLFWTIADSIFHLERKQTFARSILLGLDVFGFIVGICWAAWQVMQYGLSSGQFGATVFALWLAREGVATAFRSAGYFVEYFLRIKDLFVYLDLQPEEGSGSEANIKQIGDIHVEGVSFRYPQAKDYALVNVNAYIKAGEKVALVGENGSGKTTFVKLLLGLYPATSGRIMYSGQDFGILDLSGVRHQIATVFQDFNKYAFSLRDNIGFGRVERLNDLNSITEAAARGGVAEFVASLPAGYETLLTTRFTGGVDLSGGEWQRVAISRSYMRDAPFVILDEPTAALDPRAESDIFRRFAEMSGGRTAILISHRLGSCRICDRILVFREGQLIEDGNHEELLRRKGTYARMWAQQAKWYHDEGGLLKSGS